jgi:serine/threonine protein kinase
VGYRVLDVTSAFPPRCAALYRPERELASGGFGSVWLARQEKLDRPVAIKLLKSDVLAEPEQVERFLAEAKITASLTHPHIVTIFDRDVEAGVPWIVYELLPGRTLRALLADGALSPADALKAAAQVAAALCSRGIAAHLVRDLRSEHGSNFRSSPRPPARATPPPG